MRFPTKQRKTAGTSPVTAQASRAERADLLPAIRDVVSVIRRHKLSYAQLQHVTKQARIRTEIKRERTGRVLPQILTQNELQAFYEAVERGPMRDVVLLRLLYYTAVRNSELCRIRISDVDWKANKIFIDDGKGSKDRYVLFGKSFGLVLRAHTEALDARAEYLFETAHRRHITDRRVRQLVTQYARQAKISKRVYPHLLRHQMLTYLTGKKLTDAQIQLISGHGSKKSLEVYQHLSLGEVQDDYQRAVSTALDHMDREQNLPD